MRSRLEMNEEMLRLVHSTLDGGTLCLWDL
jgi:hypothetical protein